jgi:hypothetical protein
MNETVKLKLLKPINIDGSIWPSGAVVDISSLALAKALIDAHDAVLEPTPVPAAPAKFKTEKKFEPKDEE